MGNTSSADQDAMKNLDCKLHSRHFCLFLQLIIINFFAFSILVTEEELQKLYKNFSKLDKDKSGSLEPEEFFDIPELANNPLVKRVIAVLDKNKDGSISFLEFVQGLNSLSAGSSQQEKLRFAFQIYDINNDGYISNGELFTVIKMMVGNNLNDVQLQQLVDRTIIKADKDLDGKISFEEFTDMVKDLDVIDKLTISY